MRRHIFLFLVFATFIMGGHDVFASNSLSGKVIYDDGARVSPSIFDSDNLQKNNESPPLAMLFDRKKSPSSYRTAYREHWPHRFLKIVRPYNNASFPRNIAPPTIRWEDGRDDVWLLMLKAPGWEAPLRVVTKKKRWQPDAQTWEAIKKAAEGNFVSLEIRGCALEDGERKGNVVYYDRIRFRISNYATDPIIVYRLVTPLFHAQKTPNIYYRYVNSFETHMFLPGKGIYCTNCHSFPKAIHGKPPVDMSIAVRDTLPTRKTLRILGLYNFKTKKGSTININSFFMGWSPDGEKVAVTIGNKVIVRPLITLETQQFYVCVADIAIVDKKTLKWAPLPGASEPEYMESFPTWSPDGKTIVFSRAKEIEEATAFEERRFDLCKVPYNGGRGGHATLIPGASHNGKSNYAARYSPDGKWIVFCQAESASLVESTSDLWILSTKEGAKPRKLECNCDHAMDSHHSWSSNSRWLVFATKRDDGIFARLYLTEIDENGHASPPVALPLKDDPMACFNVPEFLANDPGIDPESILRETSTLRN